MNATRSATGARMRPVAATLSRLTFYQVRGCDPAGERRPGFDAKMANHSVWMYIFATFENVVPNKAHKELQQFARMCSPACSYEMALLSFGNVLCAKVHIFPY